MLYCVVRYCLCFIVFVVFYTIVINFVGIKFSWISLGVLYMIIYEVLYTWCLRYNIWSAWFLDIRISTCSLINVCHMEQMRIVNRKIVGSASTKTYCRLLI